MQQRMRLVQGVQCYVILNKLHPSAVVSAHLPNALPMKRLDNLRVTHQSQVTHSGLSYESVFLSSATIPGETFHFDKGFAVVREDITPEGLFDKEPAPPPQEIQNSTSPPSALGDPIEAGFSTPPIGQKTFTLSGIRGWRSMMTCN